MRPLRPAEARRFLAAAEGHPLEPLFVLAVTTGMRQGELLGLRWRDIDWSARRVAVRHTLVRMDGRWWLGDPKTASSQRAIDLTAPTLDLLRTHRARNAERMLAVGHALTDDDLVFCDDAGQPLWGRHVTTRQLRPLLRDAGLPPIRFHDLRHTFATLQLAAGTNPKIVSEVRGTRRWPSPSTATATPCPTCRRGPWPASTACWAARRAAAQRAPPARSRLATPGRIRDQIRDQTARPRARKSPIRAWIGPKVAKLVPHTGIAASVRWAD